MSGTDRRSVGELLLDCDLTTRRLLIDPDALDAAALVRAWPEVVQAAHEFLQALPSHHPAPGPRAVGAARGGDLTGERLHIMATAMHAGLRQRLWPGDGPGDDQLLAVAGNLVRAHDLVRQHLRPSDRPAPAVLAAAAAARTRVLHALYVGSHAIQLAVRAQVRDVQIRSHALSPRRVRSQLNALQFVTDRLGAFEQVAGAEVYRAFPGAMAGERREPPAPERLSTAFAAWDVEAHRALARQPSMANLAELTRVQTSTLAHTGVILDAATEHHIIDARTYRAQLEPRLTTAETAWGALHATFRDLTGRAHRAVSPDLRVAGAELVHALSEIVLDGTAVRNPATIAARVDLTPTARTLVGTLASPHQVSLLLLDAALDPRTRVNAKGRPAAHRPARHHPRVQRPRQPAGIVDRPARPVRRPRHRPARTAARAHHRTGHSRRRELTRPGRHGLDRDHRRPAHSPGPKPVTGTQPAPPPRQERAGPTAGGVDCPSLNQSTSATVPRLLHVASDAENARSPSTNLDP